MKLNDKNITNTSQAGIINREDYNSLLVNAIGNLYPIIIFCNITQNTYQILEASNFDFRVLNKNGTYEQIVSEVAQIIPEGKHKERFLQNFSSESVIQEYIKGSPFIQSKIQIKHPDKGLIWLSVRATFSSNQNNDVLITAFINNIDKEVKVESQGKQSQALMGLLASEYDCLYYVNLDNDSFITFGLSKRMSEKVGEAFYQRISYTTGCYIYAEKCTKKQDRELFIKMCSISNLKKQLEKKDRFTGIYRNELNKYCEMKCVKLGDWKINKTAVLGFAVKDKEIRKEQKNQKELKAAKEKAEAANRAKSDFLARMSHDIRTPINGVIGMTELALKNINNPEQVEYCLNKITKSSQHLLSLVNDILDMNHIENKKIEIAHNSMNILAFADGCISITTGNLINRKLQLITDFSDFKHPFVLGDELHLRQVIINVLGNAVKYTPDGGKIFFRIREVSSGEKTVIYRFEIEDNGYGMAPDYLEHIWESFSQEDNNQNKTYKGTGLGMSIAKSLLELMGGNISVSSKQNEGSCFTIEIPFAIDYQKALKVPLTNIESVKNLTGSNILLVEDNEINRETSQQLLKSEGAVVTLASNGQEAVQIFSKSEINSFDAILMDITMPVMDGLTATRIIRSMNRPDSNTTPIIAITANAFEGDIQKSLQAGMNAHLTKPLEINMLIRTLLKCIRWRSANQAEMLKNALNRVNKDGLTGVNNRMAYESFENKITNEIITNSISSFAIIIFDINNLKKTNDLIGHEAGDQLIIDGCKIICNTFKHSPVFRVGGDEFIAFLRGEDFEKRKTLLHDFQKRMNKEYFISGAVSIASGIADFIPNKDISLADVFKRADENMYKIKAKMKKQSL